MNTDRHSSCCFTGHRNIPDSQRRRLEEMLDDAVRARISQGYTVFCAGGAQGFDTMAAKAVIKYKKLNEKVRLHLYLPCQDQDKFWSRRAKAEYERIKQAADSVFYISRTYDRYCMMRRNRAMVDDSSCCIGYCTNSGGGSARTLSYALDKGLRVINLAQIM